jgi:hypothetical protein
MLEHPLAHNRPSLVEQADLILVAKSVSWENGGGMRSWVE